MITWYKNNWQHTVGLVITIERGSDYERSNEHGYTHMAEHLMFSGTIKLSRSALRERTFVLTNKLEATTSRTVVRLFCYFDLADFTEVSTLLSEMIFNWHCDASVFADEQKQLVAEARDYFSSYQDKMDRAIYSLLPLITHEPLGSMAKLRKIKYRDVNKINQCWQRLLTAAPITVTVIGGGVSAIQVKKLEQLFCRNQAIIRLPQWQAGITKLMCRQRVHALITTKTASHINNLLLDRIYFWRWQHNPKFTFDYDFIQQHDVRAFYIYHHRGIKRAHSQLFFTSPITKSEFTFAKEQFLRHLHQMLDGVDAMEVLTWWSGFSPTYYADLPSTDPQKIYRYFERLSYKKFLATMPKITA